MFKLDRNLADRLEQLESTYKISHRAGTSGVILCEIVDKRTGKVYAKAIADTEPNAVKKAVESIDPSNRPKTPAELATENADLHRRIAELEGRRSPQQDPDDEEDDDEGEGAEGEGGGEGDADGTAYDSLSNVELGRALKVNGIEAPKGQRNDAWRKKAIVLMQEHEAKRS